MSWFEKESDVSELVGKVLVRYSIEENEVTLSFSDHTKGIFKEPNEWGSSILLNVQELKASLFQVKDHKIIRAFKKQSINISPTTTTYSLEFEDCSILTTNDNSIISLTWVGDSDDYYCEEPCLFLTKR